MKMIGKCIAILCASLISINSFAAAIGPCQDEECVGYFKEYKKYAKAGYADAMATLGELYYYGHGTEQSLKNALRQYRSAAKYGSVKGQYKTAMIYLTNEEYKDLDEGVKYLKKAARSNNIGAAFLLGVIYFNADFYEKDLSEADKWLTKAYQGGYKKMNSFIEFMQKSDDYKAADFPDLLDAIADNPYILVATVQAKPAMPAEAAKLVNTAQTKPAMPAEAAKLVNTAQTKPQTTDEQPLPEQDKQRVMEVITITTDLHDLFSVQLASLRNTYPEKGAVTTGTKISGKSCAQLFACGNIEMGDYNHLVGRLMGDHSVVKFYTESPRGPRLIR